MLGQHYGAKDRRNKQTCERSYGLEGSVLMKEGNPDERIIVTIGKSRNEQNIHQF